MVKKQSVFIMLIAFLATACSNMPDNNALNEGDNTTSINYEKPIDTNGSSMPLAGDAEAQYVLGESYLFGKAVPVDDVMAAKWLELSAAQGYPQAQFSIGWMYLKGRYYDLNYDVATTWFKKAAEQGNLTAQYNLGDMYENGDGTSKDYILAYMYFNIAAENGDKGGEKRRDIVSKKMTSKQIVEAQRWTHD